ncbi:MAG: EutN/CcmL family microcompartment protein [Myxococcota bacterium]|nr:EutN/CcmL family microcompartment protein [Myxococcota bacterium]
MILARVLGNEVSSVQHPAFDGQTVLVCQPVDSDGRTPMGKVFLACDAVQAGEGDLVLCSREGNTARELLGTMQDPYHAVVMAIVDMVDGPKGVVSG